MKFSKEDINEKKATSLACSSDSDEYTDSELSCIRAAMNILVYSDNTERKLREKLMHKGFSPDDIDTTVEYVIGKGYLKEKKQLYRTAEILATAKLYGRRRIATELFKKGFKRNDIGAIDYSELGIDFIECCAALIIKLHKLYDENDRMSFQIDDKGRAALVRYGYSIAEINKAVELIHKRAEESEEAE